MRDPAELAHRRARVRHERDDELRERGVEAVVGERQLLCPRLVHLDLREARAQRPGEVRRRLDRDHGRAACQQLARQRAGPGADIEHAVSIAHAGEVREQRREPDRVAAHEIVIGLLVNVEDPAHTGNSTS